MSLIIVESPTKARTFNAILKGQDYYVFATMGHIRDLPSNKLSVDYEKRFKPDYKIIKAKEKVVEELKELAEKNREIIFATDPDREGESISYHAAYVLGLITEKWPEMSVKPGITIKRIVFHEITPQALEEALKNPEDLRLDLIKAQQARRILDRIVGYELSPLLWKKMGKYWLSAGRVQTVALRLIVEREKEIVKFKPEEYYQIVGTFGEKNELKARLVKKNGLSYEQKFSLKLFANTYTYTKTTIGKNDLPRLVPDLKGDTYTVADLTETIQSRFPPPPFTTSLLQQEGFQRHGFSSKMSMRLAQDLYERGFITYHRTDSFNLSTQFVFRAKEYIEDTFGEDYSLAKPRGFKTKSKMAQEAHEAIRPTKLEREPEDLVLDKKITSAHKKLYKLIFERAVATQMREAQIRAIKLTIQGKKGYEFQADMQNVVFEGFLRLLNPEFTAKNKAHAPFKKNDAVRLADVEELESLTKPPPRYNEASLIKMLEEKGIGRPSTYAPIISLIQEKNYVEKENRYLKPTLLGQSISDYLAEAFPDLFDLNFTAGMEEKLDEVAQGKEQFVELLSTFNAPFQKELVTQKKDKTFIDVQETVSETCPKCGSPLVIRYSRFGKFLACSNYPKCKFTKPYLQVVPDKFCPKDGGKIVIRYTKSKRKFYGCMNYPKCDFSSWKLPDAPKNAGQTDLQTKESLANTD